MVSAVSPAPGSTRLWWRSPSIRTTCLLPDSGDWPGTDTPASGVDNWTSLVCNILISTLKKTLAFQTISDRSLYDWRKKVIPVPNFEILSSFMIVCILCLFVSKSTTLEKRVKLLLESSTIIMEYPPMAGITHSRQQQSSLNNAPCYIWHLSRNPEYGDNNSHKTSVSCSTSFGKDIIKQIDLQSRVNVQCQQSIRMKKRKYLLLCEYSTSLFKTSLIAKLYN